jgi:hypothetical protein
MRPAKKVFKEIMAENLPILARDRNLQNQEPEQTKTG